MKNSTESPRRFKEDERSDCAPSSKMIRAALNLTSDIVLFFDPQVLRFVDVNEAACTALGYSKAELLTMELADVIAPESRDALASVLRQSGQKSATASAKSGANLTTLRQDGSALPVEATIRKFRGMRRQLMVLVGRDATDRKHLEQLCASPLHIDPLTGLPNRAVLESRLHLAASRPAAAGRRLGLFLVDLDHFKQVNDERGHLAGDAVLKTTAARLAKCLRGDDLVVRYGGDEFVVLADGLVDVQEAAGLAERIVTAVRKPIALDHGEVRVSASVGVAIARRDEDSDCGIIPGLLTALIARADHAMYQAKAAGRDGNYVIQEEHTFRTIG